jgi:hypothetical protein
MIRHLRDAKTAEPIHEAREWELGELIDGFQAEPPDVKAHQKWRRIEEESAGEFTTRAVQCGILQPAPGKNDQSEVFDTVHDFLGREHIMQQGKLSHDFTGRRALAEVGDSAMSRSLRV